ncbi:MAG: hypothetical protein JJE27_00230 [Thermoleophilia bacterium]|nr:hypothetical protein [Thermoleophilia bacterium]
MRKRFWIAIAIAAAALVVTVAATAAVTAGNTGWRWGNPLPQGNDLRTLEMIGSRGYAAGASGTLLRTDDAGATWSTVRTGLLDDVRLVRAIGPDTIVFAGRCALRRSDDGGQTVKRLPWTPNDETCSPEIKSFHFPSANVGYLLLDDGDVFATGDAGASWTKRTALPGSPVKGGGDAPGDIWFTADGTGVATAGKNVYRTTDSASSWAPVNNVSTGNLKRFDFVNANIGIVVGDGKNALATADSGVTWTPVSVNAGTAAINLGNVDCANPNDCVVAAADGSQLYITGDRGTSWSAISPSSSAIAAAGFASATRIVAVGATGATVVSNDAGATWQTISGGVGGQYTGIRAISTSTAYAYGDGGALVRTTDGGNSWVPVGVSTSARLIGVDFPSAQHGYALDVKGVLMRTVNGGASWQFLDTGGVHGRAIGAPADGTIVLIGPKGIRRSTDGGGSFSKAAGKRLPKARLNRIDHAGSALFAYGTKASWFSVNAGRAWKPLKLPERAKSIVQLDMISARSGYLLDGHGELWSTRTAGRKWTRIETTGTTYTDTIAFGNLAHGYLTDDSGRILYTSDAGRTWSRQYPFYFANGGVRMEIDAPSALTAYTLIAGSPRIFATTTGGTIGAPTALAIKPSASKVRKNSTIKVSGRLSPATGGERVSVVARVLNARDGTLWAAQEATVATNGSFTTRWKIKRPTIFIARWSGNAGHDGDAAKAVTVKLKTSR